MWLAPLPLDHDLIYWGALTREGIRGVEDAVLYISTSVHQPQPSALSTCRDAEMQRCRERSAGCLLEVSWKEYRIAVGAKHECTSHLSSQGRFLQRRKALWDVQEGMSFCSAGSLARSPRRNIKCYKSHSLAIPPSHGPTEQLETPTATITDQRNPAPHLAFLDWRCSITTFALVALHSPTFCPAKTAKSLHRTKCVAGFPWHRRKDPHARGHRLPRGDKQGVCFPISDIGSGGSPRPLQQISTLPLLHHQQVVSR